MRKLLFLLLLTAVSYGQVSTGQETDFDYGIKNNAAQTVTNPVNIVTQGTDGTYGKALPANLPISYAVIDSLRLKAFLSTGILKGGVLTINTDPTKFNLSAGEGVYSDYSDPDDIIVKIFNFPAFIGVTPAYLTTGVISYVAVNYNNGNPVLIQQQTPFTNEQRRQYILIGALVHSNLSTINVTNEIAVPADDVIGQLGDVFKILGNLNYSGNKFVANGANLSLNKSAGVIFKYGSNFDVNKKDPHFIAQTALTNCTFRYRSANGTEGADRTVLDPDNIDVANVVTALAPNTFSIQTVNLFQSGVVRIQRGQSSYTTLSAAKAAINTREFQVETNIANQAVKRAYVIMRKGTTSLLNTADAEIVEATKYDGTASGGVALTLSSIVAALGYTPEDVANKSTTLTPSDTLYPTNNAVLAALPKTYAKVVYVNAVSPNVATIFDLNNPPVTNDNLLKNDTANLYIGTDASTWVYNGSTYVTKSVTSSTSNFYLLGTTIDAGNSKTAAITRQGDIRSGGNIRAGLSLSSDNVQTNAVNIAFETANTIASFDAGKQLKSLSTTTYPSLSELSYVKGVTSGLQSQINGKIGGGGSEFSIPVFGVDGKTLTNSRIYDSGINNINFSAGAYFAGNLIGSVFLDGGTNQQSLRVSDTSVSAWTNGIERLTVNQSGTIALSTTPTTSAGAYRVLTYNETTDAVESVASDVIGRSYKVYTALLTQSGTNAPTATVMENNTGATLTFAYVNPGIYTGTFSSNVLTSGKTTATLTIGNASSVQRVSISSTSLLDFTVTSLAGGLSNNLMSNSFFEIRVYN